MFAKIKTVSLQTPIFYTQLTFAQSNNYVSDSYTNKHGNKMIQVINRSTLFRKDI